jgi:ABC-type nitrate/sulfonate/bicarbonate transport system substrate-binding protein
VARRKELQDGSVDAVLGWEFNWPITLALLNYPVRIIPAFQNGLYYYGIVYFATDEFIEKHSDILVKFLLVTKRGWEEVLSDPERYAKYIVEKLTRSISQGFSCCCITNSNAIAILLCGGRRDLVAVTVRAVML